MGAFEQFANQGNRPWGGEVEEKTDMAQGRPKNVRAQGSGEKLYMALKLAGVSWGAKLGAGHIAANKHWTACGLPKSSNTINEDIRSGIPANRLDKYAEFFQVPPALFVDTAISPSSPEFSCEILKSRHLVRTCPASAFPVHDAPALERFVEQNQEKMLYELHKTIAGIYTLYYKDAACDILWRGAVMIAGQFEGGLQAVGSLATDGGMVDFKGNLFRWHNCLHIQCHSSDYQILGYMMTPDPLQSLSIRLRTPFCMKFYGVTENLGLSMEPQRLAAWAVRHPDAGTEAEEAESAYRERCRHVAEHPVLLTDDVLYAAVWHELA